MGRKPQATAPALPLPLSPQRDREPPAPASRPTPPNLPPSPLRQRRGGNPPVRTGGGLPPTHARLRFHLTQTPSLQLGVANPAATNFTPDQPLHQQTAPSPPTSGQGAAIAHHGERVHLQTVIVMKTGRFAPITGRQLFVSPGTGTASGLIAAISLCDSSLSSSRLHPKAKTPTRQTYNPILSVQMAHYRQDEIS